MKNANLLGVYLKSIKLTSFLKQCCLHRESSQESSHLGGLHHYTWYYQISIHTRPPHSLTLLDWTATIVVYLAKSMTCGWHCGLIWAYIRSFLAPFGTFLALFYVACYSPFLELFEIPGSCNFGQFLAVLTLFNIFFFCTFCHFLACLSHICHFKKKYCTVWDLFNIFIGLTLFEPFEPFIAILSLLQPFGAIWNMTWRPLNRFFCHFF